MILVSSKWEHHIVFDDGSITNLVIENPITYRNYILELNAQINGNEGSFILSEENKEMSISKHIAMLTDPICFDFDTHKINTRIYKDLVDMIASCEYVHDINMVISSISRVAEELVDAYRLNITYSDPDVIGLIKMLAFRLNPYYESPAEKILEFMNIYHEVLGIGNFVILNTELYFHEHELGIMAAEASSMKHNVLFIGHSSSCNVGKKIIIDEDNCEIL